MKVVFKSSHRGMEKVIGKVEKSILEVLWDGESQTGREIFEISPTYAVSTFVDIVSELDEEKIEKIIKLIEERKKQVNHEP